jgi:hypothetical protein
MWGEDYKVFDAGMRLTFLALASVTTAFCGCQQSRRNVSCTQSLLVIPGIVHQMRSIRSCNAELFEKLIHWASILAHLFQLTMTTAALTYAVISDSITTTFSTEFVKGASTCFKVDLADVGLCICSSCECEVPRRVNSVPKLFILELSRSSKLYPGIILCNP